MDNMEQDPEEIPMEQVLAEIRQMLSAQTTGEEKPEVSSFERGEPSTPVPEVPQSVVPPVAPMPESIPEPPKPEKPDYFLLTPAMRCDLPSDSELSETVQRQKALVLNKLQQQSATELSPALVEWLNAHLPAMIEKVLSDNPKLRG